LPSILYAGTRFVKEFSPLEGSAQPAALDDRRALGYPVRMFKVLLPGTFDPPTNGHLNILKRAARLFDAVEVVIAVNPGKTYFFSAEERREMMVALAQGLPHVTVSLWNGLIVDFADRIGVHVIVRGVRALADFDYEFELSQMNRSLNPRIETIFLPTDQKYSVIRSSTIKEIAGFGGDISGMVPPIVASALREKLRSQGHGRLGAP
jgi:pantetheine-phosphate adenylyltransferase